MINQKRKTAKIVESQDMMDNLQSKLNSAKAQAETDMKKALHIINIKPMKRKIKVILFTGKKGQTYFRILGGNNKTVAQSEGYLSIKNAMKTVKLLQGGNEWIIKDETTKK